jgi:hypothetical protein
LSEYRFTHGNLIILYAIYRQTYPVEQNRIPDYVNERVKLCLNIHKIIEQSKPDGKKTVIWVVGSQHDGDYVSNKLVEAGVNENIIAKDYISKNVTECFDRVSAFIKDRTNPPYLYFIGSVWLDHRPVKEVEEEKLSDAPRKGLEHYKRRTMDKAIDIVLNRMFPEERSRS